MSCLGDLALSLEAWKENGELMEPGRGPLYYLYMILERRGVYFLAYSFMVPGLHSQILAILVAKSSRIK